jgi:hypothetical protein
MEKVRRSPHARMHAAEPVWRNGRGLYICAAADVLMPAAQRQRMSVVGTSRQTPMLWFCVRFQGIAEADRWIALAGGDAIDPRQTSNTTRANASRAVALLVGNAGGLPVSPLTTPLNTCSSNRGCPPETPTVARCYTWKSDSKVQPFEPVLVSCKSPPWSSMILREMESPNPIPEDFVVKNGSNIWVPFSGFIPGPVSWRESETVEFPSWVLTSRRAFMAVGPVAIASIPFLTK